MIDAQLLLADCRALLADLVDDLRTRAAEVDEVGEVVQRLHGQASAAGRTDRAREDWAEELYEQVGVAWILATVFIRFCEDTGLVDEPYLSGPGGRRQQAQDHRSVFFTEHPGAGDRAWIEEVVRRAAALPGLRDVLGEHSPLWLFGPSDDGARALLELWWRLDEDADDDRLSHDFTDPARGTRFLGDLYQDLSTHAKAIYALLQTPEFVESFILDRALDPALAERGVEGFRMIDPTCGSGHFLLGGFARLLAAWREAEPQTPARTLVQRALDGVAGIDVNPFAVAIARFRLLVAACDAAEVVRLADAPWWRLSLAVGDSLLHGTPGVSGWTECGDRSNALASSSTLAPATRSSASTEVRTPRTVGSPKA